MWDSTAIMSCLIKNYHRAGEMAQNSRYNHKTQTNQSSTFTFAQISNCSNEALVMLFLKIALRVRITRSSDVPSARPGYPRPVLCEPP
jgi:hypothetical protein